ncbi:phosphotransferase family protein [Herbidospora mongoliensis]|uniref:phosphotransferase family protein n=1 Tax=Herbidospora mongoliensis TaxID=688067 RepID=UPI000A6E3310|nr:aminoglycoside phosphotransferase family protein [Herbidospora mongoliensis]
MIDGIGALVARHLGRPARSVVKLGEGWDNVAFEVDGDLIVRGSKEGGAEAVRREARLLAVVAEVSPVPVPRVLFVDEAAGVMAYRKLAGEPLDSRLGIAVAAPLGAFLAAVNAVPAERVEGLVEVDDDPFYAWLAGTIEEYHEVVRDHVPGDLRGVVEKFLRADPPRNETKRMAFCHNDLGCEHVLTDGKDVTGVIDWTDAAISDPAYDLGLILRDLGPDVFAETLRCYREHGGDAGPDAEVRARFYARCAIIEDIAYGLTQPGARHYADEGLSHLAWTFAN